MLDFGKKINNQQVYPKINFKEIHQKDWKSMINWKRYETLYEVKWMPLFITRKSSFEAFASPQNPNISGSNSDVWIRQLGEGFDDSFKVWIEFWPNLQDIFEILKILQKPLTFQHKILLIDRGFKFTSVNTTSCESYSSQWKFCLTWGNNKQDTFSVIRSSRLPTLFLILLHFFYFKFW